MEIRLRIVGMPLEGTSKCRFKQGFVTSACVATVFCDLAKMEREDDLLRNPFGFAHDY